MPTVGQRPASISLGTAVSPTPLVLLARLGNPTVTGGVSPAISTSPLRLVPTLATPALVRGHAAKVELMQGPVIRATWFQGLTGSFATYSLPLTQAQLDAITNWADLRLRVTATGESGRTALSWAELAVPVGAAGLTVSATALRLIPTLPNVSATTGGSPPNAVIGSPPGPTFSVQEGQTITFDPVGTNDDAAWGGTWDFGDGTTHTGTFNNYASHVVNKVYSEAGTYLVTWTVLDGEGNSDIATVTIVVTEAASTPTNIELTPASFVLNPGQQQTLAAVVLDQFGNPMTGQVVGWTSNNTSRATVAPSTGGQTVVTAQAGLGAVVITAATPPGGSVQATSAGTIAAPSSSIWPRLPAGYTVPSGGERSFTAAAGTYGPGQLVEGLYTVSVGALRIRDGSTYVPGSGIANPGVGPHSPNMIGEAFYPPEGHDGSTPVVTGMGLSAFGWHRLYIGIIHKISSNWYGHTSGVNKCLIANIHGSPCLVLSHTGSGTGSMNWQFRLQNLGISTTGQTGNPIGYVRNISAPSGAPAVRSVWNRVEIEAVANTPGVQNGIIRLWQTRYDANLNIVDGPILRIEATNVGWSDAGQANIWTSAKWEPIYGGANPDPNPDPHPELQMTWMDAMIVAGAV